MSRAVHLLPICPQACAGTHVISIRLWMAIYGYKAQLFSNSKHTRFVWSYLTHPSTNDRGSMPNYVYVFMYVRMYARAFGTHASLKVKRYFKHWIFSHGLPTVYPGTTLGKWPTWCTVTLYNTFIVIILYMFRATLCSSPGGQIVLIQHLV